MNSADLLEVLLHGNQLKSTPRTGWLLRGVPRAESVAAHSYGVVFAALVLAQVVAETLDLGRVLAMAALHDLPEGATTDIPTPAWSYLPAGIKTEVERRAMLEMLDALPIKAQLMAWWEELHAAESAEARLVHDADKLDMLLQALRYEQETGNRRLSEFWRGPYSFHYRQSQAVYEALLEMRES